MAVNESTGDPVPLHADRLYRFYHAGDEEVLALQGVSLQVAAGEILAVTGPSGSGKSTLMACLAGLDDPDGGTVSVVGRRLSRRPEPERAALRAAHIGVLYQSGNLIGHLTLVQNIVVARHLVDDRPSRRTVTELCADLGLARRGDATPGELSGGELARAGLAVALANDPIVLLADEPTGELDGATEAQILALLRSHAEHGAAIVIVSHSPAVADAADRRIHLDDGKVVA